MATADEDDYNRFNFCFKDCDNIEEEAKLDDYFKTLNNFYEGFIETNYLFIHKLLSKKDKTANNVCKAKFFIITLAFLYYFNNKGKDNNKDKIQILKNKYDLNDSIDNFADIRGLYEIIKPKVNEEVNLETNSGTSVTSQIGHLTLPPLPAPPLPAPPAQVPPSPPPVAHAPSSQDTSNILIAAQDASVVTPQVAPASLPPVAPLPASNISIAPLPSSLPASNISIAAQQTSNISEKIGRLDPHTIALFGNPLRRALSLPVLHKSDGGGTDGTGETMSTDSENLEEKITELEPKKSSNDYKDIFIINKLLIVIMKNIMTATKTNLDKITFIYNELD